MILKWNKILFKYMEILIYRHKMTLKRKMEWYDKYI